MCFFAGCTQYSARVRTASLFPPFFFFLFCDFAVWNNGGAHNMFFVQAMLCYKNGSLAREAVSKRVAGGSWETFDTLISVLAAAAAVLHRVP